MIELGIDDIGSFKDTMEPDELELKKTGPITKSDETEPTTSDDSATAKSSTEKQPSTSDKSEPNEEPDDEEEDEDEEVNEEAKSKSQQRLFGMVHAYNKGELKKSDVDADLFSKIKKIANGMSDKDFNDEMQKDQDPSGVS